MSHFLTDKNHPDYLDNPTGEVYDLELELNNFNKQNVMQDLGRDEELYEENDKYSGCFDRYLIREENAPPVYIGITVHDHGTFNIISPSWTGPDKTITTLESFVELYEAGVNMTLTNPERFPDIAAKMKADEDARKTQRQLERESKSRLKGTSYAEIDEKLNGRDIVDDVMDNLQNDMQKKGYRLKVKQKDVEPSKYADDLNRFMSDVSSQDTLDKVFKGELSLFDSVPEDLMVSKDDGDQIAPEDIVIKDVDKRAMRKYIVSNNISVDDIINGSVRAEDFTVKRILKEQRVAKLKNNLSRRKNNRSLFG